MTLFSLSFLFFFMSWLQVHLLHHVQSIKALEEIKGIHKRIDLEEDVFDLVRQGYEKGRIFGKARYEVLDDVLYIYISGTTPYTLEYDIIVDESFEWRKKYDSIK